MSPVLKTNRRTNIFSTIIVITAILISASIAGANGSKARRIDVSSTSTFATTNLGTNWIDEDGIWHFRGAVAEHDITGDIQSRATVVFNADIDVFTGSGVLNGYAIWYDTLLNGYEISGGFEGSFEGKFNGWSYEINTVYNGYGGFKQTKLFVTITGQEPAEHHEGFIIGPRFE